MAISNKSHLLIILTLIYAATLLQDITGSRIKISLGISKQTSSQIRELYYAEKETWKRMKIGSVAPTCTYNECRGCKYKCRAEQVPVEGNDPINSPYHYRCVCHR